LNRIEQLQKRKKKDKDRESFFRDGESCVSGATTLRRMAFGIKTFGRL
jgi:hypothetical protein